MYSIGIFFRTGAMILDHPLDVRYEIKKETGRWHPMKHFNEISLTDHRAFLSTTEGAVILIQGMTKDKKPAYLLEKFELSKQVSPVLIPSRRLKKEGIETEYRVNTGQFYKTDSRVAVVSQWGSEVARLLKEHLKRRESDEKTG